MSSRQLEERREQEQHERLAEHLGLTSDELDELAPDIDENERSAGTVYVLNFHRDSPRELLSKVRGLSPSSLTMQIDSNVLNGYGPDYEDDDVS